MRFEQNNHYEKFIFQSNVKVKFASNFIEMKNQVRKKFSNVSQPIDSKQLFQQCE